MSLETVFRLPMTIENSASGEFYLRSSIVLTFLIVTYPDLNYLNKSGGFIRYFSLIGPVVLEEKVFKMLTDGRQTS